MNRVFKRISLLGQRFGKLVVQAIEENLFLCICDCGNNKICSMQDLNSGNNKSCGCLNTKVIKGRRNNFLTALDNGTRVPGTTEYRVLCLCVCGIQKLVRKSSFLSGRHKSCGCMAKSLISKQNKIHGKTGTYEHRIWMGMIDRCNNEDRYFEYYKGKGIAVVKEWLGPLGFQKFLDHVGPAPSKHHSIDRMKNHLGYEPGNVRWATIKEQARNKTSNKNITAFDKTQCLVAWSEEFGIPSKTISTRLKTGWTPENAVKIPISRFNRREMYSKQSGESND